MVKQSSGRTKRQFRGAALVEFAVILPVMIVFFLGLIELSRILLLQHTADTAAYEAARVGIVPGALKTEVDAAAHAFLDDIDINGALVTVDPPQFDETTKLVTVDVLIPINGNSWVTPKWFMDLSVTSTVCLVCERSPAKRHQSFPDLNSAKITLTNGGTLVNRAQGTLSPSVVSSQ